jgi:DNA-directed RNA polymerase sigma subunit (sigma70/sigma32)
MTLSYQERYDQARPSYVKTNEKRFADLEAGTTVLIPSPQDIETVINELAPDEIIDLTELRDRLATMHDADGACPVMTGMHLRIVAEIALDALDAGVPMHDVTPVWNAIAPKSNLAKKLSPRLPHTAG